MKIAILSYKLIEGTPTGYSLPILTISNVLIKLGHTVEIFSISNTNKNELINGKIVQHHIKGAKYYESGFGLHRIVDFLSLYFFGYRSSIKKLNDNGTFTEVLKQYNPGLIIVSQAPMLSELTIKCLRKLKKAKLISYTDSFGLIETSFNTITYMSIPTFMKKILNRLLYKKYIIYMKQLYANLLKHSTAIITPTNKDKYHISADFRIKQKNIFVIPPIIIKKKNSLKQKQINRINVITFIGAAGHGPNIEAVEIIKEKIAPKLKNIKFFIVGKGWEKERRGNVETLGEVKDLKTVFNKTNAFIAPITSGAGMKTKIATYLEAGKPIIGTSVAFEGYGIKDGINGIVEDNIDKIYKRILELNKDTQLIKKYKKNSSSIVKSFSEKMLRLKWKTVLSFVLHQSRNI